MAKCIFCQNRTSSLEHIISETICKRAQLEETSFTVARSHELEGVNLLREHGLNAFVTKVCKTCNNTWMSRLESWFSQSLGELLKPEWPKLADMFFEQLLNNATERETLTMWLLKTAVMASKALPLSEKIITQEFADAIYRNRIPNDVFIFAANAKNPSFIVGITHVLRVVNGKGEIEFQKHIYKDSFNMIVGINNLILQVIRAPGARGIGKNKTAIPIQFYPTFDRDLSKFHYSFLDAKSFFDETVVDIGLKKVS